MMSDLWKSDDNWFATWFNTAAYHALYGERNADEAFRFIEALTEEVLNGDYPRVLDMGCGTGRHTAAFVAKGLHAVGIDLSPNSIETARFECGESEQLRFIQGDMRYMDEYVEAGSFDAVASLFTSIGYFEQKEDLMKTLRGVCRVLRDRGLFIVDFLNPELVISELVKEEVKEVDDYVFRIHRRVANGRIEKSIQFVEPNGVHQHYVERVRALTPMDWRELLADMGMRVELHFGDYSLNPWCEQSPRSILVARKMSCG
ncbi:MAG TPA: SAM-dependent methyltransferase [Flavobacteriales bacterium]|nr:SAM-dependent methyltransferase [Flavobacteriales bacterium]|tara:strand:- start:2272 stop:3048 length:777 start_codon:yes stop_codon:yes gene_type:complete